MENLLDRLPQLLPHMDAVEELIESILDCADDGRVTPAEAVRLFAAIKGLRKSLKRKPHEDVEVSPLA